MGYCLYITRRRDGSEASDRSITSEEWRALVDADPELQIDAANGDDVVVWSGPSKHEIAGLFWADGQIESKYPDAPLIEKMVVIAERLNAQVIGDDGETYGRDGAVTQPTPAAPEGTAPGRFLRSVRDWILVLKDHFTPLKLPFAVGSRVRDTWGNQATVIKIDRGTSAMSLVTARYDDGRILSSSKIAHGLELVERVPAASEMQSPVFEVADHFEIQARGAVLVGNIRAGTFKIGMTIAATETERELTISAIEFVDNLAKREHRIGLMFRENPSAAEISRRFPIGSKLTAAFPPN